MKLLYPFTWWRRSLGVLFVLLLAAAQPGRAQSGPYGNEWIVPGQQYVKIKIWRDGVYRLDYQYLSRTGLPLASPARLQLWRRGREVAAYVGGNATGFDASTYLEFYGQRNDGRLDAEYYKNPAEQPHQFFSFNTDTAAYFLTVGAQPGRRVAEPAAAAGTLHPYRLVSSLKLKTDYYREVAGTSHLPWLQGGEGFMGFDYSGYSPAEPLDSLFRAILPSPAPRLEAVLVSPNKGEHLIRAIVPLAGGGERELGYFSYTDRLPGRFRATLQAGDFSARGDISFRFGVVPTPSVPKDLFRVTYYRVTAAQANRWYANRRSLRFQNDSTLAGPAAFELDSIPATVVGYDVQDPWDAQRVAGTASAGQRRRYVFPSATGQQTRQLLLTDLAYPLVPGQPARPVTFRALDPARPDFVIITHPKLMQPAGGVPNAARAYAEYRASAAGGGHDTLMVTSGQLFDQFHYGERSVMALRHFALWLADKAPAAQTKYLLLLGQGIGPNEQVIGGSRGGVQTFATTRIVGEAGLDLVPTTTRAPSDNFLSSDWPHGSYAARLPTGRVVAKSAQEVMTYLNKLREYEAPDAALADWHKRALNLVGGREENEYAEFGDYLAAYQRRIERPPFSGRVVRTFNRRDYPGTLPIEIDAPAEINPGLGLITYFGHGSNTTFSLNLGDAAKYNNKGKYPLLFFFGGCEAAHLTVNAPTFGENWLLTPDHGAMALMGQTGFGYAYTLNKAQNLLYQLLLNDPVWYGKPVTIAYAEAVRRLQRDSDFSVLGEDIAAEQLLTTTWHGDPALTVVSPPKPDFIAADARLAIGPVAGQTGPVEASTPRFVLNIGVSNPGKVTGDSLEIEVTRHYSSGRRDTVYYQTFRQPAQRDTTYAVALTNEGNVFGQSVFQVKLDYRGKVAELSETNNSAQTAYSFLSGGISLLSPPEFAIVSTTAPLLVAQTNDPAGPTRPYTFELDTVPTFSSPLQRYTTTGALTADWQPTLPAVAGRDSVVWYWRVRFATPGTDPNEDTRFVSSSFRQIAGSPGGWSQSHYGQFRRDEHRGVDVDAPTGRWRFAEEKRGLRLTTTGGGAAAAGPTFSADGRFGITADPVAPPFVGNCAVQAPGLLVAVYDQRTLQPLAVTGGQYLSCGPASQPYYVFGANPSSAADTLNNLNNSAERQAELVRLLTNVPDGAYVALVSMNRLRYASLPPAVRAALGTLLGSKLIAENRLRNGDPFALLAQKRTGGGGLIQESGPDLGAGARPRATQPLSLSDTLRTGGRQGTLLSTRIGPAEKWGTFYHTIKTETLTGTYTLRLLGVDNQGNKSVIYSDIRTSVLDVSDVQSSQYPYLQLELNLLDAENRTPPQLKQWLVTYTGVPEGVVRRDLAPAGAYDAATLTKQATQEGFLSLPVVFKNVSGLAFGAPLHARVSLRDADGNEVRTALVTAPSALAAGASVTFPVKIDVRGVFGTLTAQVEVNPLLQNPNVQPELYHFNNLLLLPPITLTDRNVPPVLDVAFDGRRILSGELVSPTPLISIQLRDEDQLRHIKDARYFTVSLQRPNETTALPIDLNGDDILFRADSTSRPGTTATLEFQPGKNAKLADGIYKLLVQGRDPGNLSAGTQDYEVKFEVVSKSAITNVYPYPNPVTNKARFVFTLTGQELPRNMKIQIMTLTGRVVREIFMQELGPLHIGNNLTDFAWDGTDQYGDRLANGTYLYRVSLDDAAGTFSRRETGGDKAFKNDWGKLVLLR